MHAIRTIHLAIALSLLASGWTNAKADTVITQEQTIIERTPPSVIISKPVTISPTTSMLTIQSNRGPNFLKRLADISDQIKLGVEKGWLSAAQANELLSRSADIVSEEAQLRAAGGGTLSTAASDRLERSVTGLAYAVAQTLKAPAN